MARYSERRIRSVDQWVLITRDNKHRVYTFTLGNKGQDFGRWVGTLPFKRLVNWTEAFRHAGRLLGFRA